jgi:hypothetical protein
MTNLGQRLADEQHLTTPREYRATPKHVTGVSLLWTLFKICSVASVVIWLLIVGAFSFGR